jgi:site-specific DNA-cytosine methylase
MVKLVAYYNESDGYAAQWLRNLIAAGSIAAGDVDERDIRDVCGDDLRGYGQCHFFAGIGGWSYALRLAGWDDGRPVWTGSCPCQPFSAAGKGEGGSDARHLWPHWFRLIRECRPAVVFGEQVAAAIGWGWLDAVNPANLAVLKKQAHERLHGAERRKYPDRKLCEVCGVEYRANPRKRKRQKCCSPECAMAMRIAGRRLQASSRKSRPSS